MLAGVSPCWSKDIVQLSPRTSIFALRTVGGGDNFSNFSSGLANLQPRLRILSEDSLASIFHRRKHKGRMWRGTSTGLSSRMHIRICVELKGVENIYSLFILFECSLIIRKHEKRALSTLFNDLRAPCSMSIPYTRKILKISWQWYVNVCITKVLLSPVTCLQGRLYNFLQINAVNLAAINV